MIFDVNQLASALLEVFSTSDLRGVEARCRQDVVVFGTDEDEQWFSRDDLLQALDDMRDAGSRARWSLTPICHGNWAAGTALYHMPDGSEVPVRVSMVFEDSFLAHAHFSIGVTEKLAPST